MNANRKIKRTVAAAMTGVMVASNGAGAVYAADKSYEKEETVYVKTDPAGSIDEVIVSDWLKNVEESATIEEISTLTDIENVKGDETFTQDGENITWSADGNDIYYKGTTDKTLPISVNVTYYLDGKEISPEELAGKSGHVKIHYQYTNHEKQGDIYTPFMLVTGMVLDAEVFSNVEVTNGRLINDGSRDIVIGFGLPGMKESLDFDSMELDEDVKDDFNLDLDINIPDGFDVEADVTEFSTKMTMTVATPLDLSEFELGDIDSWDDLEDKMNELTDGVTQLVDGTGELADGVQTLKDSCEDLLDGMTELDDGANKIDEGMGTLDDGIGTLNTKKDDLVDGVKQLSDGLNTLNNKKGDLVSGVNALAKGASDLDDGAAALKKGMNSLYSGINALDQNRPELISGLNALISGINQIESNKETLTAGAKQISGGVASVDENLQKLTAGSKQVTDGLQAVNETLPESLEALSDGLQQISDSIDAGLENDTTSEELTTLVTSIGQYAAKVNEFADAISKAEENGTGYTGYVSTVNQIFGGVSQVDEGLGNLIGQLEAMEGSVESTAAGETTGTTVDNSAAIAALQESIAGNQRVLDSLNDVKRQMGIVPEELISKFSNAYSSYSGQLDGLIAEVSSDIANQQIALAALQNASSVSAPASSGQDRSAAVIAAVLPALKELKAATSQLTASAGQVQQGYNESLTEGASALSEASSEIQEKLGSAGGIAEKLTGNLSAISEGVKKAKAGVDQMDKTLYGDDATAGALSSLAAGSDQVTTGLNTMSSLVDSQLVPGSTALASGVEQLFTEGIDVMADGLNKLGTKIPALDNGIQSLKSGAGQLVTGTNSLKTGTGTLADGTSQLQSAAGQLADGVSQLAKGGNQLNSGVGTLSDGIQTLADGSSQLKDATGSLAEGTGKMKDGGVDLNEGVEKLLDGANELKDGVNEFNEKGIEKITDFIDGDLKDMLDRLDAIKEASGSYNQFSSDSKDSADKVKFIIETNGIEYEAEAEAETEAITESES